MSSNQWGKLGGPGWCQQQGGAEGSQHGCDAWVSAAADRSHPELGQRGGVGEGLQGHASVTTTGDEEPRRAGRKCPASPAEGGGVSYPGMA